jgi:hypothetical protein
VNSIIYHAFDTTNGKAYVGQTGKTLNERQRRHLNSRANLPFANALRKRPEAFVWTMLTTGVQTQQELDDAEIYWGTFFDCLVPSGYNLKLGQSRMIWSDEQRIRNSVLQKNAANRPEVKVRRMAAQKIVQNRPEVKAQRSASLKIVWANSEMRAKSSALQKISQNRPEVKARHSAAAKIAQNRPEVKARKSAAAKIAWIRRKQA